MEEPPVDTPTDPGDWASTPSGLLGKILYMLLLAATALGGVCETGLCSPNAWRIPRHQSPAPPAPPRGPTRRFIGPVP